MRSIVALLALLFMQPTIAAESRTYAVLSLVGDKLMVARFEITTGSRLDKNARAFVELPNREVDRTMVFAVEDAIKEADPGARVVLLMANDPAIYAAQSPAAADGAASALPALQGLLAGVKASHLILVTKYRGEARIPVNETVVGSGSLEGLGFYIDDTRRIVDPRNGEQSRGLLAPFGYVRFSLVDLATSRALREDLATRAIPVSNQRATSAWENLGGEEKARMLQRIILQEVAETVPKLLAP